MTGSQHHGGVCTCIQFDTKRTATDNQKSAPIAPKHRQHQQAIHLTMVGTTTTRGVASKATGGKQTPNQVLASKLKDLTEKVEGIEEALEGKLDKNDGATFQQLLDNTVLQQLEERLNEAIDKKIQATVEEMRKAVVVEQKEKEKMEKEIQVGLEEKGGFSSIGQFKNRSVEVRKKIQP